MAIQLGQLRGKMNLSFDCLTSQFAMPAEQLEHRMTRFVGNDKSEFTAHIKP